jgi:hypothetical protein
MIYDSTYEREMKTCYIVNAVSEVCIQQQQILSFLEEHTALVEHLHLTLLFFVNRSQVYVLNPSHTIQA